MARPVMRVDGARALRRQMKAAGRDMGDLKDAHARVARLVEGDARPRVPRGETGALVGSLRSSGTTTGAVVRAGYARVPYANPIHWGWPSRNIEPHPFASTAAKKTEPRWVLLYKKAVDQILSGIRGGND